MDFTRLREYIDNVTTKYHVPGADCIVYKNHEMLFRHQTGFSDIESKKKISDNDLYLIYSMTKMITCCAALQLLERGAYLLDDPVSVYIPEFEKMRISNEDIDTTEGARITTGQSLGKKSDGDFTGYAKNAITVRDLFTMGAGFDYDLEASYLKKAISEGRTSTIDLVRAMSETVLGFEPGTRFRYSLCHDVLGGLIEIWSGKKLGDYMEKNIFAPLGMKDTFFDVPKDKERIDRMASRYIYDDNEGYIKQPLYCVYNLSPDYQSGGAGLTSTPSDYALFADALANGGVGKNGKRILSSFAIELMRTNQLNEQQYRDFQDVKTGYTYGLGVRVHFDKKTSSSVSPYGEFGWDGAAGSYVLVDPENKLSMVFFQHCHSWTNNLQRELRNVMYGCIE